MAPAHDVHDADPVAVDPSVTTGADQDELAVLDQLEADLSAVEQAIESLERVTAEGVGGDAAAAQIVAAVSPTRFGTAVVPTPHDA